MNVINILLLVIRTQIHPFTFKLTRNPPIFSLQMTKYLQFTFKVLYFNCTNIGVNITHVKQPSLVTIIDGNAKFNHFEEE